MRHAIGSNAQHPLSREAATVAIASASHRAEPSGGATSTSSGGGAPSQSLPPPTPAPSPMLAPQGSPVAGGAQQNTRLGRRLHNKVLDELKHATSRKSPALGPHNPMVPPSGHPTPPSVPPPLNLAGMSGDNETSADSSADADSPRLDAVPPPAGGRAKACGLCERSFTVFRPKHTCKVCLMKICDDCSRNRMKLNRRLERRKGSRLCDPCARLHLQTPLMSPTAAQANACNENTEEGTSAQARSAASSNQRTANPSNLVAALPNCGNASTLPEARNIISSKGLLRAGGASTSPSTMGVSPRSSHLRPRHWLSLLGVAVILAVRGTRTHLNRGDSSSREEAEIVESMFAWFFLALTQRLDRLVSFRFLTSYLLGLVIFDEVMARSSGKPPSHPRPLVVKSSRSRLRSRARSVANEAAAVGPTSTSTQSRDEDEALEVEVGEKVEDGDGFTFDKLLNALKDTTSQNRAGTEVKMSAFLNSCNYICGFILAFGKATSFAASTVTGYITTIGANLAAWPAPATTGPGHAPPSASWKEQSVGAIIRREVELQIATTGGKKKPSCARCVLRLVWFVEFVEACVRYTLIESRDENCSAGASKAYEETIGSRHPWIIRKGVTSALSSLPPRSTILESLELVDRDPNEIIELLGQVQRHMRTILDELQALLKELNLQDIK